MIFEMHNLCYIILYFQECSVIYKLYLPLYGHTRAPHYDETK